MSVNDAMATANVCISKTKEMVLFNITAIDLAGNNFTANQTQLSS